MGLGAAMVASSLISGGMGMIGNEMSSKHTLEMMQAQQRFQKKMSDTAHQREVKDLKAAGLNPILSAGGQGATVPPAAIGTSPDYGSTLGNMVSKGVSSALAYNQIKETKARAEMQKVEATLSREMLKYFKENPTLKKTILGGMLGSKAGISNIGALVGTVDTMKNTLSPKGTDAKSQSTLMKPMRIPKKSPAWWLYPSTVNVPKK
jgi:hypothetical protein